MIFKPLEIEGAYIIEIERIEDERGFFSRTFCKKDFEKHGLKTDMVQCNISYNKKKGTLRGMHFQEPHPEAKLVRCTKGAIYDVIIDLRKNSSTLGQWTSVELTDKNGKMLYIPEGVAHGFQALKDDTEVFYQMSEYYYPEFSRGIRWDDEAFGVCWPIKDKIISEKDQQYRSYCI